MAESSVHIKNGQTALAVETFFKKLSRVPDKRDDAILSLAEHLVSCKIISYSEMEDLKRKYPQTNSLVMRMEALIKKRDSMTWTAILRWLEFKPLMQNELLPTVERYELQYVLEELFKCERDVTANYSACMDKLIRIGASFGHRVGSEVETDESMYETLRNAIRKRYLPTEKLRAVLTRELTKSKPEGLLLRTICKDAISWQSFVGAMKRPKSSGNPFIFYAAAKYLEIHIHVVSAISGEEYTFYPFYQPSLRARCPHVYIGHVYRKYYVSLYPKTEHEYSMQREDTLITIEKLHKEKRDIEAELIQVKDELKSVKKKIGVVDPHAQLKYKQQIEFLKGKMQAIEREKGGKDDLVRTQNEQLKYYEQMLKKSQEETERLRKHIQTDYALTRQVTLVTLDRLHREKYYIESELGEIKNELKRLKIEKGSEPLDSKSKVNYQKQIQLLKDQISTYEKERGEKEDLVKAHNDQLKSYEQMLKKSMDETKKLRKYIEDRDEKFRKELQEKNEEQKRIIEDFVAQSDRVSGASVRAVNTWSTGSNKVRNEGNTHSPRTSRRHQPDTSRGYSPSRPKNTSSSYSPPSYDRQSDGSQVKLYERTSDLPNKRRNTYDESQPPYQRRPPPDNNWEDTY